MIFPAPDGSLPDRYDGFDDDISDYPAWIRAHGVPTLDGMPELADGLAGLEETRRVDLEQWMDGLGLDAVVFPAVADVGPADADINQDSARPGLAQRRVGGQRQPGAPASGHSNSHRSHGPRCRYRHAGGPHVRRPGLHRQLPC